MKKCPRCGFSSPGDDVYCPDDGAHLVVDLSSGLYAPTQIVANPNRANGLSGQTGLLYFILGGMVVTVFGLAIALYFLADGGSRESPATGSIPGVNASMPVASSTARSSGTETDGTRESITTAHAASLMAKWRASQNSKNFLVYRSLYAPTFVGLKDTPDSGSKRYGYRQWLADRREMVRNFVNVEMHDVAYSVEGMTVVVTFRQVWRSLSHCDVGYKTMTVKMFADGPKITSERISNPVNC